MMLTFFARHRVQIWPRYGGFIGLHRPEQIFTATQLVHHTAMQLVRVLSLETLAAVCVRWVSPSFWKMNSHC